MCSVVGVQAELDEFASAVGVVVCVGAGCEARRAMAVRLVGAGAQRVAGEDEAAEALAVALVVAALGGCSAFNLGSGGALVAASTGDEVGASRRGADLEGAGHQLRSAVMSRPMDSGAPEVLRTRMVQPFAVRLPDWRHQKNWPRLAAAWMGVTVTE